MSNGSNGLGHDKYALLRMIPKVDRLMLEPSVLNAERRNPRHLILRAITQVLDEFRDGIMTGEITQDSTLDIKNVSQRVIERVNTIARPHLRPLINATGVVVHTNLGRSILAKRVLKRLRELSAGYSNLEYDLNKG